MAERNSSSLGIPRYVSGFISAPALQNTEVTEWLTGPNTSVIPRSKSWLTSLHFFSTFTSLPPSGEEFITFSSCLCVYTRQRSVPCTCEL